MSGLRTDEKNDDPKFGSATFAVPWNNKKSLQGTISFYTQWALSNGLKKSPHLNHKRPQPFRVWNAGCPLG
jgi:hypothetical protein